MENNNSNSNANNPGLFRLITIRLKESLMALGLHPRVESYNYETGKSQTEKVDVRFRSLLFYRDYKLLVYVVAQLKSNSTSLVSNPTLLDYQSKKADAQLSKWLGRPVKVVADPNSGTLAIGVALAGATLETFVPICGPILGAPGSSSPSEFPTAKQVKLPKLVDFFEYVSEYETFPNGNGNFYPCLGVGTGGPLRQSIFQYGHSLWAGKTRSGKSTALRAVVTQALMGELLGLVKVQLALIDLSGVTFHPELFGGMPQVFGGRVITDVDSAVTLLHNLIKECDRRSKLFARAKGLPENLEEFNLVAPIQYKLPVLLVFIEEMSALADDAGEKFLLPLKKLIWQAAKFGIYFHMAGQDFRAETCNKTITDNTSTRILFGQVSDNTARVLGFEPKDQRIRADVPGRGLAMLNGQVSEFQGLYLPKLNFLDFVNQLREQASMEGVGIENPREWEEFDKNIAMTSQTEATNSNSMYHYIFECFDKAEGENQESLDSEDENVPPDKQEDTFNTIDPNLLQGLGQQEQIILSECTGQSVRDLQRLMRQKHGIKNGTTFNRLERLRAKGLVNDTTPVHKLNLSSDHSKGGITV